MLRFFPQPVATGVLLGQGWYVGNEVFTRGSYIGVGLCCAALMLGLVAAMTFIARAGTKQAAVQLSLFWMCCTLNAGLSAIAQLRLHVGKFSSSDDALVANSFLSSMLLGASLPHAVQKITGRLDVNFLMPCVVGIVVTEAICSTTSQPLVQACVPVFLFSIGIKGIASDGIAFDSRHGRMNTGDVHFEDYRNENGKHQPFFPATVLDNHLYSPHFLVHHRIKCLPRGTVVVPLISLVGRQPGPDPSRLKGKDRGPGVRRTRTEESLTGALPLPQVPQINTEEASRRMGAAEVGSDIRWDVMFEEMRRVDKIMEDESKVRCASRDLTRKGELDGLRSDNQFAMGGTGINTDVYPVLEPPDIVQVPDEFDDEDDEVSECDEELHPKVHEIGPALSDDEETAQEHLQPESKTSPILTRPKLRAEAEVFSAIKCTFCYDSGR